MDLADVTVESFAEHVGTTFEAGAVDPEGGRHVVSLQLREATPWPAPPGDRGRQPFALLFRGPVDPQLAQATYQLTHPAMGTLDVFIVPVGREEEGVDYEAVFT